MDANTEQKTIAELCEMYGKSVDSVRVQFARTLGKSGRTFSRAYIPTEHERAVLKLYCKDNVPADVRADVRVVVPVKKLDVPASPAGMVGAVVRKAEPPQPLTQAQESEPTFADVRAWLRDALLISLVVGHAGLVWYDCGRLWDVPGTIAGGLAFGLIVATLMFATDASKNLTSQWALLLALLVDAGAYWVHYPVFSQYDAPEVITRVLCVFLCAMSFGALFLFRHQKNN